MQPPPKEPEHVCVRLFFYAVLTSLYEKLAELHSFEGTMAKKTPEQKAAEELRYIAACGVANVEELRPQSSHACYGGYETGCRCCNFDHAARAKRAERGVALGANGMPLNAAP